MKKLLLLTGIVLFLNNLCGQQKKFFKAFTKDDSGNTLFVKSDDGDKTLQQMELDFGRLNEAVSFGLSLGFNNSLENIDLAQISPVDNTLILSDAQKTSFVLSTVVSVPLTFKRKWYRYVNREGDEMGEVHRISGLSLIAIVNLATFSEAQNGTIFNQRLSGGLGISYNFSEAVAIGLSYELISYRKPRDFLKNLNGQEILENGVPIESLDTSDNKYFFDRYANTFSIKLIYKLTTN